MLRVTLLSTALLAGCSYVDCQNDAKLDSLDFMAAVAKEFRSGETLAKREKLSETLDRCWDVFPRFTVDMMGTFDRSLISIHVGRNDMLRKALELDGSSALALSDPVTSVIDASMFGDVETLSMLHEHGVDLKTSNRLGQTALFAAIISPCNVTDFLVRHGVDVNHRSNSGITALTAAIVRGNGEAAECLLDAGAKVYDFEGRPLSELARENGLFDLAQRLEDGHRSGSARGESKVRMRDESPR